MSALVVWQPKLGGREKDVPAATATFPDPRAHHFWDPQGWTVRHFQAAVGLDEDAWDLYLIYGADARWDGADPPTPSYWMHQLVDVDRAPRLDRNGFGDHVRQALASPRPN